MYYHPENNAIQYILDFERHGKFISFTVMFIFFFFSKRFLLKNILNNILYIIYVPIFRHKTLKRWCFG